MNIIGYLKRILVRRPKNSNFSQEEETRIQYYTLYLMIGIPLMVLFGILNFRQGNQIVTFFCIVPVVGQIAGWLLIRSIKKAIWIYRTNFVLFLSLLIFLLIFGGEGGSKALWLYTFPLISFFLFGKLEGIFWNFIIIVTTLILFIFPPDFIQIYPYGGEFKVRFVASYLTITVLTYWLEYIRKHYSDKITLQNEALNKEIAEREKIEQEREELIAEVRSASKAKSKFLANMSHEIRTPLNGVIGMTTLLLDTELNSTQTHYVKTLKKSGEFLLTIINDILDVSKIEAGKLDLNHVTFNIRELLDNFSDIAMQLRRNQNVDLVIGISPEISSEVRGDQDRLQQILLNLTSNALKFTENGTVSIRVTMLEEGESHILLRFSVKDTGIGIAAEDVSKLFKSFSQIDSSTTREYYGTGLGLIISKQLCELMDGEIGVESSQGNGSEFWFTARLDKNNGRENNESIQAPDLAGASVLLSLKNSVTRQVIKEQVEYWGAVTYFVSAKKGLSQIIVDSVGKDRAIDFLIIDGSAVSVTSEEDFEILHRYVTENKINNIILIGSVEQRINLTAQYPGLISGFDMPLKYIDLVHAFSGTTQFSIQPASRNQIIRDHQSNINKSLQMLRVLLAEDNLINQEVLVGVLSRSGIQKVDIVDNGLSVLANLHRCEYDIIIMDISMPKMDGLTVTREIRNGSFIKNSSTIPIVALTAHAIKGDRQKCIEAGMNAYLTKPVKPLELVQIIEVLTGQPLSGDEGPDVANVQYESESENVRSTSRINYKTLLDRLMGDKAMVNDLLMLFSQDIPGQLQQLKIHLQKEDLPEAKKQAHKLTGAAANMSVDVFCSIARTIEQGCGRIPVENLNSLFEDLEEEFLLVKRDITKMLSKA